VLPSERKRARAPAIQALAAIREVGLAAVAARSQARARSVPSVPEGTPALTQAEQRRLEHVAQRKAEQSTAPSVAEQPTPTPRPPGGGDPVTAVGSVKRGPPEQSQSNADHSSCCDANVQSGSGEGSSLVTETVASIVKRAGVSLEGTGLSAPLRATELRAEEERRAQKALVTMCRNKVRSAVDTLVEIMEDRDVDPRARVNAARTVIEFGHGKAPQQVNISRVFSPEEQRLLAEAIILRRTEAEKNERAIAGCVDAGPLDGKLLKQ